MVTSHRSRGCSSAGPRSRRFSALRLVLSRTRSRSAFSAKPRAAQHHDFYPISRTTQRRPKDLSSRIDLQQTEIGRARELRRTITKRSHRDAHARASTLEHAHAPPPTSQVAPTPRRRGSGTTRRHSTPPNLHSAIRAARRTQGYSHASRRAKLSPWTPPAEFAPRVPRVPRVARRRAAICEAAIARHWSGPPAPGRRRALGGAACADHAAGCQ